MMTDSINDTSILHFLEKELGVISGGWTIDAGLHLQIVEFEKNEYARTFISTLGLHRVSFPQTEKEGHFEWFMEFYSKFDTERAVQFLGHYVLESLKYNKSPVRGSFIEFDNGIWKYDNIVGVYFCDPVYRSDEFIINMNKNGAVVIWAVPIVKTELKILNNQGWESLENFWIMENTNLLDPLR